MTLAIPTKNEDTLVLTVIGAGTILPAAGRNSSCHLLRTRDAAFVFDLGPGSVARLALAGIDYRDIDTVFISHLHPDHTLDIVTLLQANNATPGWSRIRPLSFYGCRGLKAFVAQLLEVFRDAVPHSYTLEIFELTEGVPHSRDGVTVEVFLTEHTSNSLAFRVGIDDRVFTYSGDAAMVPAMVTAAKGADIFLCEASFLEEAPSSDHLTAGQAAQIAAAAEVAHLVLTHTYPATNSITALEQARACFDGSITVSTDGTVVRC